MKLLLERHEFSPEQNKVYFLHNGKTMLPPLPAHSLTSIKAVRQRMFRPTVPGLVLEVWATNTPDRAAYDRQYKHRVSSLWEVRRYLDLWRAYHNLPGCVTKARIHLIG
jgi:hypothetical protein